MAEGERNETGGPPSAAADGWAAHEEEQRRAWQRTTARQRLAWLEDAKRFAARAQQAARTPDGASRDGGGSDTAG